jgi:hypothetical protein
LSEANLGYIVNSSPGLHSETLSQKKKKKKNQTGPLADIVICNPRSDNGQVRSGRIGGQPQQKISKSPFPISTNKPGLVVHICIPSYMGGISKRIIS